MNPLNPHSAIRHEPKEPALGASYPMDSLRLEVKNMIKDLKEENKNEIIILHKDILDRLNDYNNFLATSVLKVESDLLGKVSNLETELKKQDDMIEKIKKCLWNSYYASVLLFICIFGAFGYLFIKTIAFKC